MEEFGTRVKFKSRLTNKPRLKARPRDDRNGLPACAAAGKDAKTREQ